MVSLGSILSLFGFVFISAILRLFDVFALVVLLIKQHLGNRFYLDQFYLKLSLFEIEPRAEWYSFSSMLQFLRLAESNTFQPFLFRTCFLMGPLKQLQKMFERGRLLASLMYLLSIVFTLVAGLVFSNPPLALVFVIGQYIAMAWYSITYIPFARYNFVSICRMFKLSLFLAVITTKNTGT